jgi:hypothetical protein
MFRFQNWLCAFLVGLRSGNGGVGVNQFAAGCSCCAGVGQGFEASDGEHPTRSPASGDAVPEVLGCGCRRFAHMSPARPGRTCSSWARCSRPASFDGPLQVKDRVDARHRLERDRRDRRRVPAPARARGVVGEFEELAPGVMAWMPPLAPHPALAQAARASAVKREFAMPQNVALVGLDIAKSIFHLHAADRDGRGMFRRRLKREEVEPFFRALPACRVGLEACPGAHHWGRLLRSMGHDVRLLPAQYVRPYVKTNKNDAADAEAICEAMTRPTMRFVPIKEAVQQEVLVVHRVREVLIRQRTQLINAVRGHLTEFGVVGPQRAHRIGLLTAIIEDETDTRLPVVARRALLHLVAELRAVTEKVARIDEDLPRSPGGSRPSGG